MEFAIQESNNRLESKGNCVIIEDDPDAAELVASILKADGFEVAVANDGTTGIAVARAGKPDLVIVDYSLPDISGNRVCEDLRTFTDAYIVMVTGERDVANRVMAFTGGADDYITKPFAPMELVARVNAMLRRPRGQRANAGRLNKGELEIDLVAKQVLFNSKDIGLTGLEFEILSSLVEASPNLVTRNDIVAHAWPGGGRIADHVVDVHIHKIRKKLKESNAGNSHVQAVRGQGYRFFFSE